MAVVRSSIADYKIKNMGALRASISLCALFFLCALLLSGCGASLSSRHGLAEKIVGDDGLRKVELHAAPFYVTAYMKPSNHQKTARIYIEGDGLAWLSKTQPSLNPTPIDPYALRLMQQDKASGYDRVYLARPCQFSGWDRSGMCPMKYWTTHRYAPEVVASYKQLIDQLKISRGWETVELVGYSGGATLALLVARGRDDISALRTVAGNLDIDEHSRHHKVDLMPKSLNPANYAQELSRIPQYHFVGGADPIVPVKIAYSYMDGMDDRQCLALKTLPEVSHGKGWIDVWAGLLQKPLPC